MPKAPVADGVLRGRGGRRETRSKVEHLRPRSRLSPLWSSYCYANGRSGSGPASPISPITRKGVRPNVGLVTVVAAIFIGQHVDEHRVETAMSRRITRKVRRSRDCNRPCLLSGVHVRIKGKRVRRRSPSKGDRN